jgi:cell division protein FtsI (penicillin-binding protein 3)
MRSRIVLILITLTSLWAIMIARAAYLQLIPDSRLQSLKKRQFETVVTLNPRRGDVNDRNGHELAVSMTSYSLFADPKIIEEPRKVAQLLVRELKMPAKQIDMLLRHRQKRFVWIERHVDHTAYENISAQKIRGLGFIEESKRIYPNERLLAHVLGFVGGEEQGLEGLELQYNDQLRAAKKQVSVQRDARGRPLIVNGQVFNQVPDGAELQLTVDREMQFVLEQELHETVRAHEADSAVGVVLDAQTSEVLAMAASPGFDPNRSGQFGPELRRNRTVTDSYEPGSTMKTFVIAGALGKGLIEPNTKFDCGGGQLRIGKRVIREADSHHKFSSLTTSEILAYSSNVGTTRIAYKLGPEGIRETLTNFGFGQKSGIDLPGEAKGIVQPLPWREHLMANISFGHGITATALQIANAYAVIANGGYLKQPYIVKTVRDRETGEVMDAKPKVVRRVLSDDVVAKMRLMLAGVTGKEGTGWNARVAGYPVAGKTGTAQKVNPNGRGYLKGAYIGSFAGFLPANDPKFVIYVAVDNPRKEYYGAAVAAPVFARVAGFAVRKSGLSPVLITEENLVPKADLMASKEPIARDVDEVADGEEAPPVDRAPAAGVATWKAIKEKISKISTPRGAGGLVTSDNLAPSAQVSPQGPAADLARVATPPVGSVVPDLTGLTLREVLARLHGSGVDVRVHGQGFVSQTIPAAGANFSAENKQINIYLSR